MSNFLDDLEDFINATTQSSFLITPDPYGIGSYDRKVHVPVRDEHNIVVQHDVNEKNPTMGDGGDSAMRTGLLAFCGSHQDAELLPDFEVPKESGIMVRHPFQHILPNKCWNDPGNCSRDQLIPFIAGCWRIGRTEIVQRLLAQHLARGLLCQNIYNDCPDNARKLPDPLGPHEVMFMRACAGDALAMIDPIGQLSLLAAIRALPTNAEPNAMIVESIVCCQLDAYIARHGKTYKSVLRHYWGEQRGQLEIAETLISVVEIEYKRYQNLDVRKYLTWILPLEQMKFLFEFCKTILQHPETILDPSRLMQLAKKFATAAAHDLGRQLVTTIKYIESFVNWIIESNPGSEKALPALLDPVLAIILLSGYFDGDGRPPPRPQLPRSRWPPPYVLPLLTNYASEIGIDINISNIKHLIEDPSKTAVKQRKSKSK